MPQKFQLKTLFHRIITEHENTLFLGNYSERMINSRTEQGFFLKQLRSAFADAVANNLWEYKIATFQLDMTGHFGATKDRVSFQFFYSYDPANIRLNLVALKTTLNDEFEKTYLIKNHPSKDLPSSVKVHQDLVSIQKQALQVKAKEMGSKRKKIRGVKL